MSQQVGSKRSSSSKPPARKHVRIENFMCTMTCSVCDKDFDTAAATCGYVVFYCSTYEPLSYDCVMLACSGCVKELDHDEYIALQYIVCDSQKPVEPLNCTYHMFGSGSVLVPCASDKLDQYSLVLVSDSCDDFQMVCKDPESHVALVRNSFVCFECENPFQTRITSTSRVDGKRYHPNCVPTCCGCNTRIFHPEEDAETDGEDYLCAECCLGRCTRCNEEIAFTSDRIYKDHNYGEGQFCKECYDELAAEDSDSDSDSSCDD